MALPSSAHTIEFVFKEKATGKQTVQLVVNNNFVFFKKTKASGVGKKAHFKCSKVIYEYFGIQQYSPIQSN